MPTRTRFTSVLLVSFLTGTFLGPPHRVALADPPASGIAERIPWTTSRVKGSPEPAPPYVTERAFPSLKFDNCLDLATAPGLDRLFVVEQAGKIYSFPPREDVKSADLFADLGAQIPGVEQVYALVFHPEFEKNRYCYVCYIKAPEREDGTHVARFRVNPTEPPTLDPSSETTIITWFSGGHNGCCLKFGPDGALYISTGDGGPANPPDPKRAGQDVTGLLSAILRLDVDHPEGARNYRIPPDNPFVSTPGARGEIWAYGLRNPWRMSFDRRTGDLWVGDVGWERWEMLNRVQRGGNYGWAVTEGRQPTHPEWARGPTPILPPTIDHPHSESSSITDGLTYYGSRIKELHGHHIYGDYDTGKIWGFRFENGKVVDHRELADTTHRIVGFGEDRGGEFYLLDHTAGTLHRLVPNPEAGRASAFPRTLSETGLFSDVARLAPALGVIPYSINVSPWEDHARADRLVALPDASSIRVEEPAWAYPKDSVLVKTLSLELRKGNPFSARRIETQVLHFDGLDWQPYSYQWNDEQTDAVLLGSAGAERTLEVVDPDAVGGTRQQVWRFSGRAECQRCHNKWAGPPLGFNAPQLNREHTYGGASAPQLETFTHVRVLDRPVPEKDRVRLTPASDPSTPIDDRARSYLHVNCSHCHRMHAGSAVLSKMTIDLPLDKTDMLGVRPTQGTFGIHDARVIAPGDPYRSVLLYRMEKLGSGRMPYIGSTEVDREGVALIFEWLSKMTDPLAADASATRRREAERADLDRLRQRPPVPNAAEIVDRLLSSTSAAMRLPHAIDDRALPESVASLIVEKAAKHEDVSVRDLFERFLPADQRVKRLGSVVEVDRILAMPGDADRGKEVFFKTEGVTCKNCHQIDRVGAEVGPDLSTIGKKYDRAQLLESILEPSKFIDPQYVTYLVETKDGRVLSGLLVEKDDREVALRDAQNKVLRLPTSNVEHLVTQPQSLMPELLLRDMTARQVADLLEYLGSLK
ncbi:MAG: PQQ-dependent sugar dehydrogenase [Isosphaeraceae bacterium]